MSIKETRMGIKVIVMDTKDEEDTREEEIEAVRMEDMEEKVVEVVIRLELISL